MNIYLKYDLSFDFNCFVGTFFGIWPSDVELFYLHTNCLSVNPNHNSQVCAILHDVFSKCKFLGTGNVLLQENG